MVTGPHFSSSVARARRFRRSLAGYRGGAGSGRASRTALVCWRSAHDAPAGGIATGLRIGVRKQAKRRATARLWPNGRR